MDIRCALLPDENSAGAIAPLFWQHGEPDEVLREEMRQMRAVGIRQCIVESRPFPDWMGPDWWRSLDTLFEEAARLGMKVWLFDDRTFPSGLAGKRIAERHPEHVKVYLAERMIDAKGPHTGASVQVGAWLGENENLVAVVAARRIDSRGATFAPETFVDLTESTTDGVLRWDVPEGWWRIFVFVRTRSGGEEWTKDYLNPLVPEAVQAYLREVHEPHHERYGQRYKDVFAGFFTDEPRFGNASTYDAVLGEYRMVLPWSDDLLAELDHAWKAPFRSVLPALLNDAGELSRRARYVFMNAVSGRFGRNFTGQIGEWCRARGLRLIGHVVEDNNAHARLGYGAGHFFRALQGQDMSGLDYVYQVWPEWTEGRALSPFGNLDLSFFYWGITKLATSAAHLDPRKHGQTMCEIFGAYGWRLGLRNMKWLTDHACVRGVNFLVPHAFSPKEFPDPDCPPHFYARGNNPQWHLFALWSQYAERICQLLSGGQPAAPVAVAYHAEAEWAGGCEHFQHAVRTLAEHQIDCLVVPWDDLTDEKRTAFQKNGFSVNRLGFQCLIVPWAERLPAAALRFCGEAADAGMPVVFTRALPDGVSDGCACDWLAQLKRHPKVSAHPAENLADVLHGFGLDTGVRAEPTQPHLRVLHYKRGGLDLWYCVNESTKRAVDTHLCIRDSRRPLLYDAARNAVCRADTEAWEDGLRVRLRLEPYGAVFVVFADEPEKLPAPVETPPFITDLRPVLLIERPAAVSTTSAKQYPKFTLEPKLQALGDVSRPELLPKFGGVLAYDFDVVCPEIAAESVWLDLGEVFETSEVWWDGRRIGAAISPPHRHELGRVGAGSHKLRVEVATTLSRSHGENRLDRAIPLDPVGLLGPVRLLIRG